jgi:predicted alpha/beta hydrolase
MEKIEFTAADGYVLSGTMYRPQGTPTKAVLVVCAMAVPQGFYAAFCEWLADRGFIAMTFDFRGMGESRQGSLRALKCDMLTWAELDAPAAVAYLASQSGEVPITWLGHSFGGHIFAFTMARVDPTIASRVSRFTYLASGSGYWRENSPALKRVNWIFWFVLGPVLTPLFGYWPGAKLGMVGNLPAGVFYQWKAWCMQRGFAAAVLPPEYGRLMKSVGAAITCISFTDDEMMSNENIEDLKSAYPAAVMTAFRFKPAELGVKRIGHFGAFRRDMQAPLWQPHVLPYV